jgi:hypothetical protein
MKIKIIYSAALLLLNFKFILAQEENMSKIVLVESAYKPEIENADKLSEMPMHTDTARTLSNIEYSVLPSSLKTSYKIKPIKPAKLVGSPLDELYNSRLKAGLGNYFTPMVEFSIHNLRSKEYAVGAYAYHRSSHSKLELADGNNVAAGYGRNKFNIYGKRFYRGLNVEGDVFLNTNRYRYYGYNTELAPDTTLDKKEIKQFYTHLGARAEIYSTVADSGEFQYRLGIQGSYFGDHYQYKENNFKIPYKIVIPIQSFRLEIDGSYDLFLLKSELDDSREQVIHFRPLLKKGTDQWQVQVGANTYFLKADKSEFMFYPDARFKFAVIDKILEAYVGIYGKLELNTLNKIASENPYILPGLDIEHSNNRLTGYGGIQGLLSSNSGYRAEISFSTIENAYFYINDTNNILGNQFISVSDNVELIKFNSEIWYSPFTFLSFYLKGNFLNYRIDKAIEPWHNPKFNLTFETAYNFKEKFYINLNTIHLGKRYAYNHVTPEEPIELEQIWDINLGLEYRYSKVLSGFIDFNNLLAKQYYIWNQYPSQKINVMVGFSYKF